MGKLFRDFDALLRGKFTRREDLLAGRIDVPVGTLVRAGLLLGATYGLFMGLYAVLRPENPSWLQLLVTTVKVPLLFLLTLVVTFPSLYVFSALANSRLRHLDTVKLLLAAIGVNLGLLASFGPVTGFFTLSTDSYPFMLFLNIVFFAISGLVGLGFLRRAVDSVFSPAPVSRVQSEIDESPEEGRDHDSPADEDASGDGAEACDAAPPERPIIHTAAVSAWPSKASARGRRIFGIWLFIYAIVGAQMGWILRPFVGSPDLPFELFRERESNFFAALLNTIEQLLY